eukprot:3205104-Pleurochrysis_carterae.AAC.1
MYSYDGKSSPPWKLVEFLEKSARARHEASSSAPSLTHYPDSNTARLTCSSQDQSSGVSTSTAT